MKKLFNILLAISFATSAFSQAPEKMSYQAIIRNSNDQLVKDTQIGIKVSILQGTSEGTVVYTETQTTITNANGMLSIEIGGEAGFSAIDWSAGPYFIKTEIAVEAPLTTYTMEGTSQILSVPYALHAKSAENLFLKSPNGTIYKLAIQDDGQLLTEPLGIFETFTDARDNRTYKTVTIGTQTWMAENLAYLPSVVGPGTGSQTDPYYYVNGYDGTNVNDAKATANYSTYGVLYNWTAAMNRAVSSSTNPSGVQGVCPTGWHLPSDAEWTQMENYLANNGYNYDGTTGGGRAKIAKSLASTSGWTSSSTIGAVGNNDYSTYRNKSGFRARPGGFLNTNIMFDNIGDYGYWWSATEFTATTAWYPHMHYDYSGVNRNDLNKKVGFSVRCLRDN